MPAQLEKLNRLHGRCRAGKVRQRSVPWAVGRAHARSGAGAPSKRRRGEGTRRGRGQTGLWGYLGDDIRRGGGGGGGGRRHALVEARTHSGGYRQCALWRCCNLNPMRKARQYLPSNEANQGIQYLKIRRFVNLIASGTACRHYFFKDKVNRGTTPGIPKPSRGCRPSPPQPLTMRGSFALPGSPGGMTTAQACLGRDAALIMKVWVILAFVSRGSATATPRLGRRGAIEGVAPERFLAWIGRASNPWQVGGS